MKLFMENLNKYWTTPFIAILGSFLGIYFGVISNNLGVDAQRLENAAIKIETELKEREFLNEIKIQMYSEVKEAILNDDKKMQSAVLLLVNEILSDDSLFREKLITILLSSPNTSESVKMEQKKIEIETVKFVKEEKEKITGDFTIDVFYLEDKSLNSKNYAKSIFDQLSLKYKGYNVRLRKLPRVINAKTGYRVSRNEIRFEPGERIIAKSVLTFLESNNIVENNKVKLTEISPNTTTPNYISIFIRNE